MKHFFSVLLASISVISGLAGNVYKCNRWGAALFFYALCGILALLAIVVGWIETVPQPHLVPIGYGREDGKVDGLVFFNDGEPAYLIEPPKPTPLGGMGDAVLHFDDPHITRLSTLGGKQVFPIIVRDSLGQAINSLRDEMVLRGVENVIVAFKYSDAKRPTVLRYTTTCKIAPTTKGVSISLVGCKFAWWMLRN